MNKPLRILHLEDMPADAELVERQLKNANIVFEKRLVDTKSDFIDALKDFHPDIIISDHSLPAFDSKEALKIVKEMDIIVPFILVTAAVSEEYAVNIMKEGAWDYILKDQLQRLPNSISNSIINYNLNRQRKKADEILRSSEKKYKLLFESNPMPMFMVSNSTLAIIDVNEAAIKHYGYSRDEFLTKSVKDISPAKEVKIHDFLTKAMPPLRTPSVWRHQKKDGTIIMVEVIAHDIMYKGEQVSLILANDVTAKLEVEAELVHQHVIHEKHITETSIQVQEREREEIAKELHDNINQIMASTKLYVELAIESNENQREELLRKSLCNINLVIAEIRKLSQSLVAPSLGDISLLQAIQELITSIRTGSSLNLELNAFQYNEEAIDKGVKLMFYRIVQEQINNILKHSRAKCATIQLNTDHHNITLSVKDNGIGFDTSKVSGGIGLRNITNRAEFYNGTVRVISSPGNGCLLEVIIPGVGSKN